MTETNTSDSAVKPTLAVWGLVTSCYGLLYYRFKDFVRIMAVPALVSALLGWRAMYQGIDQALLAGNAEDMAAAQMAVWNDPLSYVYMAVMWLSLAAAIVAVHRLVLLNENPPRPLGITVGARELRYIGYAIIVAVVPMLPLAFLAVMTAGVNSLIGGGADGSAAGGAMVLILVLPAMVYAMVATLRFSLALPAVAVDGGRGIKARLRGAWEMAKGQTLKLAVAFFLAALPLGVVSMIVSKFWLSALVAGTVTTANGLAWIVISTALTMAMYFVQAAIISRAFQMLSQQPLAQDAQNG